MGLYKIKTNIIQEQQPQEHEDIQIEAATNVVNLLNDTNFILEKDQIMAIFRLSVVISGLWNINVINEWAKVFDIVLIKLPYAEIEKICSDLVVGLSENSQPMQSRYAAAKLIGIMAERIKDKINGQIFDRARQLCQDYESEVRLLLADEVILKIYRSINNDICENILIEKVFELVYDPEIKIKVSSIKLLVDLLDYLKNVQKRSKIANLFSEILQLVNEDVVKVMSFSQSKIISKVRYFS